MSLFAQTEPAVAVSLELAPRRLCRCLGGHPPRFRGFYGAGRKTAAGRIRFAALSLPAELNRASWPPRQFSKPGRSKCRKRRSECTARHAVSGDGNGQNYLPASKSAESFVAPQLKEKVPPLGASFNSIVKVSTAPGSVSLFMATLATSLALSCCVPH